MSGRAIFVGRFREGLKWHLAYKAFGTTRPHCGKSAAMGDIRYLSDTRPLTDVSQGDLCNRCLHGREDIIAEQTTRTEVR